MAELTIEQQRALAMAAARKRLQEQQQPNIAADMGRSALSGIRTGIEGIAGMFGDARQAQGDIAGWAAGKLGIGEQGQDMARSVASRFSLQPFSPSSQQINNLTTKVVGEPYQPQTVPGGYARTIGEFLPATAIPAGKANMATRFLTQSLIPALGSETAGQMTKGTAAEPYARIAGALAAPAATSLARRAITPLPADPNRLKMVEALSREGVPVTAGQKTGSQALRYAESELGGGAAANFMEKQGDDFTRAVLKRAGIKANRATPEVIDDAFTRIGKEFDGLAARNSIIPDRQMANDFRSIWDEYSSMVAEGQRSPIIRTVMEDLITKAQNAGRIMGDEYKTAHSRLFRAARTKDPELKQAALALRNALDDAMERSMQAMGSQDIGAWQNVRRQYKNMLVIEKAATGAGEAARLGVISPSQLRAATVQQGRRSFARGQGDFAELARAGEAVMKPLPQSGTAPRTAARNLGTGVTTILGAGAGASAGIPGAMAGAAAGAALPYVAGRAILSDIGRAYLGNQAVSGQIADPKKVALVNALLTAQRERWGALPPPSQ